MRVLIVGDSQAEGPPGIALQRRLEESGASVLRRAYSGNGAVSWYRNRAAEYGALLREFRPTTVVLLFGTNDLASGALAQALQWFRASHWDVYYSGPPAYENRARRELAQGVRALAAETFGRRYIDVWQATSRGPYAPDGIHLQPLGGRAWADVVMPRIQRLVWPFVAGLAACALVGYGAIWWTLRTRS